MTILLAAASCQMQQEPPKRAEDPKLAQKQDAALDGAEAVAAPPKPLPRVRVNFLAARGASEKHLAFEMDAPDCSTASATGTNTSAPTPPPPLKLHLTLVSPIGAHPVAFSLATLPAGELMTATVEGHDLSFIPSSPTQATLYQAACGALRKNADAPTLDVEPRLGELVREWTQLVAPDCEIALKPDAAGRWECKLPSVDPDAARQELIGIRTTMVRRWSRQPYLLARRLAVGVTLAQALSSRDVDKSLDTFCNVATASLPIELPATLAGRRWLDGVCKPTSEQRPHRRSLAAFGLAKTVAEIDFMRQLFERTSRLGSLTVRIPDGVTPAKQFLVSLKPEADVAENLTRETARLFGSEEGSLDLPKACWHPVFGETAGLLRLARSLAIAGDAGQIECAAETPETAKAEAAANERYFAESITSETEFVLPNGRSKTLRLPTGSYGYTLQALPDNPQEWDDAVQVTPTAKGQIVWDLKKPRPVIAAW